MGLPRFTGPEQNVFNLNEEAKRKTPVEVHDQSVSYGIGEAGWSITTTGRTLKLQTQGLYLEESFISALIKTNDIRGSLGSLIGT